LSLKVTLLGTGTSHGVPMIGCACAVCRSSDPRDRRTRPSILIEGAQSDPAGAGAVRHVLVDASTDLRAQALTYGVSRVDAILFTHSHADHILGLDEVRRFNALQRSSIPCYGDARTLEDVRRTFAYVFNPAAEGGGVPALTLFRIGGPFMLGALTIMPVPLLHGRRPILGFRIESFAYLTDCNRIPDESWPLLEGVRTLVLDALRDRPHPTHFCLSEALDVVSRLAPERTYFTHICHDLPHTATCARLPAGVQLAYDGLVLEMK
jgi:phosphoribosyl 1,2-cyclic phosphate phosphodiesterase